MVKPTFLCIGVQKAGTTSLINYLSQHPDIFMLENETHFFDTEYFNESDIVKYEKNFDTQKKIIGEKTPSYNYLQFAMNRIYKYNPNIKLILLLREPISRAFSQYNMQINKMNKNLDDVSEQQILDDFKKEENMKLSELKSNGNYYILRGKYYEIIEYILTLFPRKNLYIGIAEEIKTNKKKYYNEIIRFLGGNELEEINENLDTHIMEYKKPIPKVLEKKLYQIYKPHNKRLYKILGRKIDVWEKYYDTIK